MLSAGDQGIAFDNDLTFKFAIAATCFLFYDALLHVADEIDHVWSGQNTWIKWTYLFIRHFPYLAQGTILTLIAGTDTGYSWRSDQCRDWIIYQLTVNEALTVEVEALLIVRVFAMFNRNTAVVTVVSILFVSEITAMVTILALSIPRMKFTSDCIITHTPAVFTSYWILSLSFETVLFGLTLVKFFTSVGRRLGRQSIMYVLVRDGTWAYAIIFVIMLMNTLMYHLVNNPLAGLCFFWELSIMSFAGSHVLLNLRRLAARNPHRDDSVWTVAEAGTILFSSRISYTAQRHCDPVVTDVVELQDMERGGCVASVSDDTTL